MIRDAFMATSRLMHEFVGRPEIKDRWLEPSALPDMTIGALAGHTARAAFQVEKFLAGEPPPDGPSISAAQYYVRMSDLTDPSSGRNADIRQRASAEAADGIDSLLWRIGESIARLDERLRTEPPDRTVSVFGAWPMRLDDYLRTRIVELTVHIDDLAASIAVPTPTLPAEAMDEAIASLVAVALGRHGDLAVLRALTRAERDEVRALRVF